jgi:nucleotide-binding universal stress UspA family protein
MARTLLLGAHHEQDDRDALGLAVDLARPLEARIVVGGVVVPGGRDDEHARRNLAHELDAISAGVPADVPSATRTLDATSVADGLDALAVDCDAELLVLGAHHRGGVLGALRGDIAADVAFRGSCGVAVAQDGRARGAPQRVGAAWDQTPAAIEALEWAIQLVERSGGELHILRVLNPRHREGTKPWRHDEVRLASAEEEAALRVTTQAHVLWGDAAPELIKASHDLDLLAMGSGEHGTVRRTLFGSVSTRLLHDAECSVVVMPAA